MSKKTKVEKALDLVLGEDRAQPTPPVVGEDVSNMGLDDIDEEAEYGVHEW